MKLDEKGHEILDCSNSKCLNKYIIAGNIAQEVIEVLLKQVNNIRSVGQLCAKGDIMILERTKSLFKKGEVSRGIGFPTCISRNEIAGHFSPLEIEEDIILNDGDIVKIDLGVQIDGFCALVAATAQVGGGFLTGKKADCVASAWTAVECAIRMMKPGISNIAITNMFTEVSKIYNCHCLENVLSHELRQFVIDGENTILSKQTPERQVEEFLLQPNKIYAIDVVMSSGTGKVVRKDVYSTTIYKRVVENQYQLKSKSSREFLRHVNNNFPCYPFTLRNFQDNLVRTRMGIKECMKHELLVDYPILHEKEGEYIAQFKFTVVIRSQSRPIRICGIKNIDVSLVNTKEKIENIEILNLLSQDWQGKKKRRKKKTYEL